MTILLLFVCFFFFFWLPVCFCSPKNSKGFAFIVFRLVFHLSHQRLDVAPTAKNNFASHLPPTRRRIIYSAAHTQTAYKCMVYIPKRLKEIGKGVFRKDI